MRDFFVHAANSGAVQDTESLKTLVFNYETAKDVLFEWSEEMRQRGYFHDHLDATAFAMSMLSFNPKDDPANRTRLFEALQRDVTDQFQRFVRLRCGLEPDSEFTGNITIESRGRTMTMKSTTLLRIASWIGLRAEQVPEAVALHPFPFSQNIRRATQTRHKGGQAPNVHILDEDSRTATGEGSRTRETKIRELEIRAREMGFSMLFARANATDEMTRDVTLDHVGGSHKERKTAVVVYVGDNVAGCAFIPWAPQEMYDAYRPVKMDRLSAQMRGVSEDVLVRNALVRDFLLEDDRMRRMDAAGFTVGFVKREIKNSTQGQFLTTTEVSDVVDEIRYIGPHWEERKESPTYFDYISDIEDQGCAWPRGT